MQKLNKLTKGLFVLSALALLAGCDQIKMIPANYEDPIVNQEGLNDNYMGVIYDTISSNISDKVHDELLLIMGQKEYGTYQEIQALKADVEANDVDKLAAYADAHAHAFVKDDDQKLVDNQKEGGTATLKTIKAERVKAFYKDVEDRVKETIYNEIKGGSYNDKDSRFHEIKYMMSKYNDMYELALGEGVSLDDYKNETTEAQNWYIGYLDSDFKEENVFDYLKNESALEKYIEKAVMPTIYKDKMVEDYIVENNKSNLGRAYGRKVEFIKIDADSNKPLIAKKLASAFATRLADSASTLEELADAYRGFEGVSYDAESVKVTFNELNEENAARELLATLDSDGELEDQEGEKVTINFAALSSFTNNEAITVYRNTKVGSIFYSYNKAVEGSKKGRFATEEETTAYNDFTDAGKQSIEKGFRNKIIDLAVSGDYTTDDWYVKNGTITLPDSIKSRLFNINVTYALAGDTDKHPNASKYVEKLSNNRYFLTGETSLDPTKKYMIQDGSSYYFVKVEEAPSTSLLDVTRDGSYAKTNDDIMLTEKTYQELAKIITTKSSYTTKAYQSFFETYALEFHDEAVYEYFKSKYPDLYEEEE